MFIFRALKRICLGIYDIWTNKNARLVLLLTMAAVMVFVIGGFIYGSYHLYTEYSQSGSIDLDDIEGTQYEILGNRLIKFSTDGVFCVDGKNQVEWSNAYSMQTPVADICGEYMVIAEQQGKGVHLYDVNGPVGDFETTRMIRSAKIAENGVVVLLLADETSFWISVYNRWGEELASIRSTLEGNGYPLDAAVSFSGKQVLVSYLSYEEGELTGKLIFYDFSSLEDYPENHILASFDYPGVIFPVVYFESNKQAVALRDDGFIIFDTQEEPVINKMTQMDAVINSVAYDRKHFAFILQSKVPDHKFDLVIYDRKGRQIASERIDFDYEDVRMDGSEILFVGSGRIYSFRLSGKQKLDVIYSKPIRYCRKWGRLRYLVVTDSSLDQIRPG